ncbi:MAG: hypothetical protein PHP08_00585 [Candidatus Dojkabacteria bacterium]|nr:hypothetical protein [Candidatus Dojkabacteria bacterium]
MIIISNFEKQLKELNERIKHRLNELKNLHRENCCQKEFIRSKKLTEEYEKWRVDYFQSHEWNK